MWDAVASVGSSIVSGIFGKSDADKARRAQIKSDKRAMQYNNDIRAEDRKWFAVDTARQWKRDNEVTASQRNYETAQVNNQRAYLAERLREDRKYMSDKEALDRAKYNQDSLAIQNNSERLAERSAASRGIDFSKLVADAQAAGFNPMTALSMAGAYSKEINYAEGRTPFSAGASYLADGSGYNAAGGGGSGPSATPAGTFQASSGSGYSGPSGPAMSTGNFIGAAIEKGVDTWLNRPPEKDKLADSLRTAFLVGELMQPAQERQAPARAFGRELVQQQPFKAAAKVMAPAFAKPGSKPDMATSDEGYTPPEQPLTIGGYKLNPAGKFSDADAIETRYGDVVSAIYGMVSLPYDIGNTLGENITRVGGGMFDEYQQRAQKGSVDRAPRLLGLPSKPY